jgi:hypothetical protein
VDKMQLHLLPRSCPHKSCRSIPRWCFKLMSIYPPCPPPCFRNTHPDSRLRDGRCGSHVTLAVACQSRHFGHFLRFGGARGAAG